MLPLGLSHNILFTHTNITSTQIYFKMTLSSEIYVGNDFHFEGALYNPREVVLYHINNTLLL